MPPTIYPPGAKRVGSCPVESRLNRRRARPPHGCEPQGNPSVGCQGTHRRQNPSRCRSGVIGDHLERSPRQGGGPTMTPVAGMDSTVPATPGGRGGAADGSLKQGYRKSATPTSWSPQSRIRGYAVPMRTWRVLDDHVVSFTTGTIHRPDCWHAPNEFNGSLHNAGTILASTLAPRPCKRCRPRVEPFKRSVPGPAPATPPLN